MPFNNGARPVSYVVTGWIWKEQNFKGLNMNLSFVPYSEMT